MIRMLGVLVGSALAIAALILVVGIPEPIRNDNAKYEPNEPNEPNEPIEPIEPIEPVAAVVPDVQPTAEPAIQPVIPEAALVDPEIPVETASLEPLDEVSTADADLHWYAFWSPFRSQLAANGFVTQLQRVTGLDYRVVNVKPGVYEVAFAYSADSDIQAHLTQISAATGLTVPES